MSARVPAFPDHCTSMRRAPLAASTSTAMLMTASRVSTSTPTISGDAAVDHQRDAGGEEEDAVGDGVEDLAELAALVEVPRDPAVDPVGRAQHREQHCGGDLLSFDEEPHENRRGQQPDDRDDVRERDDP